MIGDIYFETTDGGLVTNRDIAKIAYVVSGDCIDFTDIESIRKYAKSCKGINKEVIPYFR